MIPAIQKVYYSHWQASQAWRDQKRADAVERLKIDLLKKARTREAYKNIIIIDKYA